MVNETETDAIYFARRVEQELQLASIAVERNIKVIHLNMAAKYATLRELAVNPHLNEAKKRERPKPLPIASVDELSDDR